MPLFFAIANSRFSQDTAHYVILDALNKVTLKQLNLTRQGHDATKTSLSCLSYTVHIIFSLVFGQ